MTLLKLAIAAAVTVIALQFLKPLALKLQLVDHPDEERKIHAGSVPLIGGIAMYLGFMSGFVLMNLNSPSGFFWGIAGSLTVIVMLGVVDDFKSISVTLKFFIQTIAVLVLCYTTEIQLGSLGNLVGYGEIQLGSLAVPVTIFAVIGVINAYNMIDGMDGLAGSLALVTLGSIALTALLVNKRIEELPLLFLFMTLLIPFLIKNLNFSGLSSTKVFMGDAGSMFLGFSIAAMLINFSQGPEKTFHPVTALWFSAIPIMDTVGLMIRRALSKKSPFQPDREHLHHFFLHAGYRDSTALVIIVVCSVIFAVVGMGGELLEISEWKMFFGFLTLFGFYLYFMIKYTRKNAQFIKKRQP